jgi:hypothetical protein
VMRMAQTIKARMISSLMSCLDLTIEAYGSLMVAFPTHLRKKAHPPRPPGRGPLHHPDRK